MTQKVYIEGNPALHRQYHDMFVEEGCSVVKTIKEADFVCLVGGSDVQPELYGEVNEGQSFVSPLHDIGTFGTIFCAERMGKPIVGICRGGQALNVYNGGTMCQHINGHAITGYHALNYKGVVYMVTSTHHQEMVPNYTRTHLLCNSSGDNSVAEIIMYPNKQMCFQPHPEMVHNTHGCRVLFRRVMFEQLGIKLQRVAKAS